MFCVAEKWTNTFQRDKTGKENQSRDVLQIIRTKDERINTVKAPINNVMIY